MVRREPQLLGCAVLVSGLARRGYRNRLSGNRGGEIRADVVAVKGALESEISRSINGICNFQLFPGTIPPRRARGDGSGREASGLIYPSISRDQTEGSFSNVTACATHHSGHALTPHHRMRTTAAAVSLLPSHCTAVATSPSIPQVYVVLRQ